MIIGEPVPVFELTITVAADDVDVFDHANNVCYIRWMQDAATAHSAANGWTTERYLAARQAWFARRHLVDYLAPAFCGEEVVIQTWVADWKAIRSTRRYHFLRRSDGTLLATAETLWAFVNIDSGKPLKIPREVTEHFIVVTDPNVFLNQTTS